MLRRKIEQFRYRWRSTPRVLATLFATLALALCLVSTVSGNQVVTVTDSEGREHTLMTRSHSETELLQTAAVVAGEHDQMQYRTNPGAGTADILIRRSFPVVLEADGDVETCHMVDGTVADLLDTCGIKLAGEDYVEPAPDTPLEEGMAAEVYRVTYEEEDVKREEVDEATATNFYESLLAKDPDFTYRLSNRDLYDVTYKHKLVNGEVVESELLSLTSLILPREPGSTAFETGIPCSSIESYDDIEMGEDGLPVDYTRKISGAVCTAYSASRGRGSSGLGLYNGTCAVNPNVIPYGTRMWITDSSQNFVYGYCIATDTGTALMEGRVDIDLFFETNGECRRFGKRQLDVYILD